MKTVLARQLKPPRYTQRLLYYYGSKARIAHLYPAPKYPTIIEPFAGAAAYSVFHRATVGRVLLQDIDTNMAAFWRWLLSCTADDFETRVRSGELGARVFESLTRMGCADAARLRSRPSPMSLSRHHYPSKLRDVVALLAEGHLLEKFEFHQRSVFDAPDIEATWFFDPPYEQGGERYGSKRLDFARLVDFIRTRKGQVILCENAGQTWFPEPMQVLHRDFVGISGKRTCEMVWVRG